LTSNIIKRLFSEKMKSANIRYVHPSQEFHDFSDDPDSVGFSNEMEHAGSDRYGTVRNKSTGREKDISFNRKTGSPNFDELYGEEGDWELEELEAQGGGDGGGGGGGGGGGDGDGGGGGGDIDIGGGGFSASNKKKSGQKKAKKTMKAKKKSGSGRSGGGGGGGGSGSAEPYDSNEEFEDETHTPSGRKLSPKGELAKKQNQNLNEAIKRLIETGQNGTLTNDLDIIIPYRIFYSYDDNLSVNVKIGKGLEEEIELNNNTPVIFFRSYFTPVFLYDESDLLVLKNVKENTEGFISTISQLPPVKTVILGNKNYLDSADHLRPKTDVNLNYSYRSTVENPPNILYLKTSSENYSDNASSLIDKTSLNLSPIIIYRSEINPIPGSQFTTTFDLPTIYNDIFFSRITMAIKNDYGQLTYSIPVFF